LAIEAFRRRQGRLPEQLDELVPELLPIVPVDPIDGRPLRYVVQGDDFLLYSIGMDEHDDGGKGETEPDIVFRIQR
jgi:hypothetical protein